MNNQDFRKLLTETNPADRPATKSTASGFSSRHKKGTASYPTNYAQQFAKPRNVNRSQHGKTSGASIPKGVRLAEGFIDRAKERREGAQDELATRIEALEEQVKLGNLERAEFEKIRDELTGGDISQTHLVKGLDRRLLERVRRGEDVMNISASGASQSSGTAPSANPEDELDALEIQDFAPRERETHTKKGEFAPVPQLAGAKRTRSDILKELKAQRQAAAEAKAASEAHLGSKFKRLGQSNTDAPPPPKIEIDAKGREVLITVDEHGNVKRKVRKAPQLPVQVEKALAPESMIAAAAQKQQDEDDINDDIFQDAGDDYDPLAESLKGADAGDLSSDSSDEEGASREAKQAKLSPSATSQAVARDGQRPSGSRNYFNDSPSDEVETKPKSLNDPSILAAMQRAAAIQRRSGDADSDSEDGENRPSKGENTAKKTTAAERLLARQDRDYEDMDMGFGGSRMDDEADADADGMKMRFSEWRGVDDYEDADDGAGKGGQKQRKRGKKKKGGDKNKASDILKVIEARKKADSEKK